MSEWFRLDIDSADCNTWLLDIPQDANGHPTRLNVKNGEPFDGPVPLHTRTYSQGPHTGLHLGDGGVLFARHDVAEMLVRIAGASIQRLPVVIDQQSADYEVINVLGFRDCIDQRRAVGPRWSEERPNAGDFQYLAKLPILADRLVDCRICRPTNFPVAILVHEEIRDALTAMGVSGGVSLTPTV